MSASAIRNSNCSDVNSKSTLNGCIDKTSSIVETREPDSDFNPTAEQLVDALDDEVTIAAEESAQSHAESQHELNQLEQVSLHMPLYSTNKKVVYSIYIYHM